MVIPVSAVRVAVHLYPVSTLRRQGVDKNKKGGFEYRSYQGRDLVGWITDF